MFVISSTKNNILIPYFAAFLVFFGMELSRNLSRNSSETSTKHEAAVIVLVSFQHRRISLLEDYY